jgi:hypothetical protein
MMPAPAHCHPVPWKVLEHALPASEQREKEVTKGNRKEEKI